jgi:hypothetical protein
VEDKVDGPEVCTISRGPGFLRVGLLRPLRSRSEAERLQGSIERALVEHGVHKLVFDMRGVQEHIEDVRDAMWAWAARGEKVQAVALLIESELSRIRANMTALGRSARVRAFGAPLQAEMWLVKARSKVSDGV